MYMHARALETHVCMCQGGAESGNVCSCVHLCVCMCLYVCMDVCVCHMQAAPTNALSEDQAEYLRMQQEGFFSQEYNSSAGGAGASSAASAALGPLESVGDRKGGERRIRRIITWTDEKGQKRKRELLLADKTGAMGLYTHSHPPPPPHTHTQTTRRDMHVTVVQGLFCCTRYDCTCACAQLRHMCTYVCPVIV